MGNFNKSLKEMTDLAQERRKKQLKRERFAYNAHLN